ncbi:hypothetical protein ACFFQW_32385 [Umezawaea endophytica]|uniref:Carboxypeptidase regulatory-like domain-containing protein n=1 Tax=Umezawaea endophytica TaxID=1654476 RepID=A0A9X2VWP3_9PSEU|nr:hypothetical protein [Umezawaea endophytica]MCS7484296.1 hypothetical protein [Umezawaea endophytica]
MRVKSTALFGLSTVLFTLVAAAPVAHAAAGPTVRWAHSVDTDLGRITLGARSDSAITEIRTHLLSEATGEEFAVVSDFTLTAGTPDDGTWETATPVLLDRLGGYRVDVELTDADGDHVLAERAGGLAYFATALFDPLVVDRTTVDHANRHVTATGRLRSRHPGTREVTPLGGAAIWLDLPYPDFDWVDAVTAADGTFTADLDIKYAGRVQAFFQFDDNHPHVGYGESNPVQIAVRQSEVQVEARIDRAEIDRGGSVLVSGQVRWESPEGWRPRTNSAVAVTFETPTGGWRPIGSLTTDADGRFEVADAPERTGAYTATAVSHDPFVAQRNAKVDVRVFEPVSVPLFTATRVDTSTVAFTGRVDFAYDSPSPFSVDVEHSVDGQRWQRVATAGVSTHHNGGIEFYGRAPVGEPGSWRARFQETGRFRGAVSAVVVVG